MKLWAIPVITAFVLLLLFSVTPLAAMARVEPPDQQGQSERYFHPSTFTVCWAILMAGCQAVLLIRVQPQESRPRARRKLMPAIVVSGFCLSLLVTVGLVTLSFGVVGDKMFDSTLEAGDQFGLTGNVWEWIFPVCLLGFLIAQWLTWAYFLRKMIDPGNPDHLLAKWSRWILTGSVAELVIAVPCHVLARKRGDCCAPLITFWGIATGISLVLLALGPAVIYLVRDRLQKKGLSPR